MDKNFIFSVSTYSGSEEEVLRIRNGTRPDVKTQDYMDLTLSPQQKGES